MIYEFAIEPELVATWHEPRVAYPLRCQMGLGHPRVPCAFPAAAWTKLVIGALEGILTTAESSQAQRARKNIEVLLRHLRETGTRRNGKLAEGESWLSAALREHAAFPFGGIVVRTCATKAPYLVAADQVGTENFPAWTPSAPPVARQPRELAIALAPVLRCATQLRFVDPYFNADDDSFFEPFKEYLLAAQRRRSVGDLNIQVHFAIRRDEVDQAARIHGRRITEMDLAGIRLDACNRRIRPILEPGVAFRAFAWGEGSRGVRMHNRYLLTELGGVAVQTGLDRSPRGTHQTDDFTLLSKEQCEERWAEYSVETGPHTLVADCRFIGSASVE